MTWAFLLAAAVVPQAVYASAPHTVGKNADGVLDFQGFSQSGTGLSELPAIQVGPAAEPAAGGSEGAWAGLKLGPSLDGVGSLGAVVDEHGDVVLFAAPHGVGSAPSGAKFIAWGTFRDTLDELGWSSLEMHTSDDAGVDDGVKMYAAGAVEGYLTAERVRQFFHNSRGLLEMNADNKRRLPTLQQALDKMISGLATSADDAQTRAASAVSAQSRNVLLQTWGLRDGYASAVGSAPSFLQVDAPSLSMVDMFILNSDGVIDELLTAYGGQESEEDAMLQTAPTSLRRKKALTATAKLETAQKRSPRPGSSGHCSGFVHLTKDNKELFFGHTTWEPFSEMTRIWKLYDFPLKGSTTRKISFSSYPGCVSSTDDYYLMDNGLAITETTLNIPRQMHYQQTATMPDFMRIMVANRVASSAQEWVASMTDSATGTYSSQWMVLDYNKFHEGQELTDGAFYVLEQAPGISHSEDMTPWLKEKTYWASFDRAFFDDVRKVTGDNMEQTTEPGAEAELYSKDNTPRAQIFKHTAKHVDTLEDLRREMTRNLGTNDAVDQPTLQIPRFAISARDDLKDSEHINPDGSPEGGVDAKVTSSCLFKSLTAQAISSPSHSSLPPFRWTSGGSEVWPGYPHEGLPDVADFDWVRIQPGGDGMLKALGGGDDCA